jgi:hypothetical protein
MSHNTKIAMAEPTNSHLDEDQLEKYSMGALGESESAGLEEHLLVCERCQQRLAETDVYVASMRRAMVHFPERQKPEPVASERPRRHWFPLIPALAGVLLVVAIGWWSGRSNNVTGPPFAVSLEATRGSGMANAPAGRWLQVRLDLAGLPNLPSYRLEMVDDGGAAIWQASAPATDTKVQSKIPGTKAGVYFIRVYSPGGVLLREFGLNISDR